MSKLDELKLKDVEDLSGINPMSSNADGGGGSAIDGGEKDEVVITGKKGSGSGSVNSAATCHKCGTPYDYGLCPICDCGSGSGSGSNYGSGFGIGSGSPKPVTWRSVDTQGILKNACNGKSRGSKCYADFGPVNGGGEGKCVGSDGNLICELPPKMRACLEKNENDPCDYQLPGTYAPSTYYGKCIKTSVEGMRHCSELR